MMDGLHLAAQMIIGLGIYNVWLVRSNKSTDWRGGDSQSLKEEFTTYGLPSFVFYLIGFCKLTCATLLLIGVVLPTFTDLAAYGMVALMSGAIIMHIKVKDPIKKSLPAATMLLLSLFVALV